MHGGRARSGPAHPAWKGGRYARYLPAKLAEKAAAAMADPELLSLRAELALAAARIAELLEAIGGGAAGTLTPAAADAVAAVQAAQRAGDSAALDTGLRRLLDVVQGARSEAKVWREVRAWLRMYVQLQGAEVRRLQAMTAFVTAEELLGLMSTLTAIITSEVPEVDRLARIVEKIKTQVLNRSSGRAAARVMLPREGRPVHQGGIEPAP